MGGADNFGARGSPRGLECSSGAGRRAVLPWFTMRAQLRAALWIWLLAALAGAGALGAVEKGTLTGVITGPSKVPVAGARVALVAADGTRRTVTADQNGRYSFSSVQPGAYTLVAEAGGYQPATRAEVHVANATTVDLVLSVAGGSQPGHAPPVSQQPSYYDDTPFKASGVSNAIDAAGYSSQAESPKRLLAEGPSLAASAGGAGAPASPNAEVESRLREALRGDPASFNNNHQLGEYYLSVGNTKGAIPYLEKAQEVRPGDDSNGGVLAQAYLDAGSPAQAQLLLRDLIRRHDAAQLHNLLGRVDEALSPGSGVKELQLAAQMEPSEQNIFDWANEALRVTDSNQPGLAAFKQGVALFPNSVRMSIGLAIALYARNSYDAAIQALCHASDLDPSDPRPYLYLGRLYNVSGAQAGEVAIRMQRFMETNPANPLAYYYGALVLWKGPAGGEQGADVARVEALFRKSLELDPGSADTHLQLGILCHDQHRDADAMAEFQAAVRLKPDDPDAHYRLAQAYLRAGDKARGQQELQLYEKLHTPAETGKSKSENRNPKVKD